MCWCLVVIKRSPPVYVLDRDDGDNEADNEACDLGLDMEWPVWWDVDGTSGPEITSLPCWDGELWLEGAVEWRLPLALLSRPEDRQSSSTPIVEDEQGGRCTIPYSDGLNGSGWGVAGVALGDVGWVEKTSPGRPVTCTRCL